MRIYRVYKTDQQGPRKVKVTLLFGCMGLGGHPRLLGSDTSSLTVFRGKQIGLVNTATLVLHAPWVAYAKTISGIDTSMTSIVATNLRTNAHRFCSVGGTRAPNRGPSVTGVVLKGDGSVAWIGEVRPGSLSAPFTHEVVACDAGGEHVLESGASIDLHSLALRGSTLTWTNSGEKRSAVLQ